MRHLLGVTDEERLRKREEILTTRFVNFTLSTLCVTKSFRLVLIIFLCVHSLKDFKDFAEAIDVVRDNGVAVAVASAEDIDAANNARSNFFEVKKAL